MEEYLSIILKSWLIINKLTPGHKVCIMISFLSPVATVKYVGKISAYSFVELSVKSEEFYVKHSKDHTIKWQSIMLTITKIYYRETQKVDLVILYAICRKICPNAKTKVMLIGEIPATIENINKWIYKNMMHPTVKRPQNIRLLVIMNRYSYSESFSN